MKRTAITIVATLLLAACATTDTMNDPIPGALPESDIAGIVNTANEGEVQQGNAASGRATSADVRAFAQMMVADHTAALDNARSVFAARAITPGENDTTRTLRANSQTTIRNLGTYTGAAFDRAYMRSQVDLHQWLLSALDTALIPSARSPEVRQLLQTQRASVAAHLERARTILGGL